MTAAKPSVAVVVLAVAAWLRDCINFSREYERTGFLGGLNWYRCSIEAAHQAELQVSCRPAHRGAGTAASPRPAGAGGTTVDPFAFDADGRPSFEERMCAAGQPFEWRRLPDTDTWQMVLTDPDGARVARGFAGQGTSQPGCPRCRRTRLGRAV